MEGGALNSTAENGVEGKEEPLQLRMHDDELDFLWSPSKDTTNGDHHHLCPREHIFENYTVSFDGGTCDICHYSFRIGDEYFVCRPCHGFAVCSNCTGKSQEPNLCFTLMDHFDNGIQLFDIGNYGNAASEFQKCLDICEESKREKWDIPQQLDSQSVKYLKRAQLKLQWMKEGMQNIQNEGNYSADGISYNSRELRLPGVSVYHLQTTFLAHVRRAKLNENSNIHEIENLQGPPGVIRRRGASVVCPVDGKKGAAYVNCLDGEDNVGEATHMLSYSWSYKIGDIVDSLDDYCKTHNLDPKRTYIWICCLCINQHRVVEHKESGGSGMLNFQEEFPRKLKGIGHMLAMMAPWQAPVYVTRLWCVYEIYAAHTYGCKVDIVIPPKEKESLEQDVVEEGGGIDALYKVLGNTNVRNADATVQSDKNVIFGLIESTVGCQILNNEVNELLRAWMKQVLLELVATRDNTNDERYAGFCNNIGFVLNGNGEYDAALELYQKCLAIEEAMLGTDHISTATTYCCIGNVLNNKGDYDGALEEYRKCLAIREASLGTDHPDTATAYNNIGSVLDDKGDFDGALEQYQKCLAIREAALGKEHLSTATTYSNIGLVLKQKGDHDGALTHYNKCLLIQKTERGESHPLVAVTINNIGSVLDSKGDYEGALLEFQKCLAIDEAVLGKEHPSTATTYNNIGKVMNHKGDYGGALRHYKKSLAIQLAVFGESHLSTAQTYHDIGNVLGNNRQYKGAVKHCMKCLGTQELILGRDHPDTKSCLDDIKRWKTALSLHKAKKKSMAANAALLGF